uniref:Secreted RxLR-like effector n=1 Tax=Bremia lactucae TaxID=4779 RepID=A0A3B7TYL3_BRELC|nr:secreted RxLR-like effector [Bremia lactucae]
MRLLFFLQFVIFATAIYCEHVLKGRQQILRPGGHASSVKALRVNVVKGLEAKQEERGFLPCCSVDPIEKAARQFLRQFDEIVRKRQDAIVRSKEIQPLLSILEDTYTIEETINALEVKMTQTKDALKKDPNQSQWVQLLVHLIQADETNGKQWQFHAKTKLNAFCKDPAHLSSILHLDPTFSLTVLELEDKVKADDAHFLQWFQNFLQNDVNTKAHHNELYYLLFKKLKNDTEMLKLFRSLQRHTETETNAKEMILFMSHDEVISKKVFEEWLNENGENANLVEFWKVLPLALNRPFLSPAFPLWLNAYGRSLKRTQGQEITFHHLLETICANSNEIFDENENPATLLAAFLKIPFHENYAKHSASHVETSSKDVKLCTYANLAKIYLWVSGCSDTRYEKQFYSTLSWSLLPPEYIYFLLDLGKVAGKISERVAIRREKVWLEYIVYYRKTNHKTNSMGMTDYMMKDYVAKNPKRSLESIKALLAKLAKGKNVVSDVLSDDMKLQEVKHAMDNNAHVGTSRDAELYHKNNF